MNHRGAIHHILVILSYLFYIPSYILELFFSYIRLSDEIRHVAPFPPHVRLSGRQLNRSMETDS